MRATILFAIATLGVSTVGCGPVFHTEMLGESIHAFTQKMKNENATVWLTNTEDSGCDSGCQGACGSGGGGGKGGGALGGLFGKKSGGSYDRLAHSVFSNYLTRQQRMRVIETHRHNYSTKLNTDTHKNIEVTKEGGEKVSSSSCEDLCMLDEAKKRNADKILVYKITRMTADKMTIHFRLSDVKSGLVENSQTLKVEGMRAFDFSHGSAGRSAPRRARPRRKVRRQPEPEPVDEGYEESD